MATKRPRVVSDGSDPEFIEVPESISSNFSVTVDVEKSGPLLAAFLQGKGYASSYRLDLSEAKLSVSGARLVKKDPEESEG